MQRGEAVPYRDARFRTYLLAVLREGSEGVTAEDVGGWMDAADVHQLAELADLFGRGVAASAAFLVMRLKFGWQSQ